MFVVYTIGRIDKDIYKCIAEDMVTDEVVITDKQLHHIRERHPEAYEDTIEYVSNIVQDPDYIIEDDKHAASGLLIKRIPAKEHILIVLRICTTKDSTEYKNSIITSWEISEKRLQNYLRNKKFFTKRNKNSIMKVE